ncbi:hydroxyisourate hydrolase [Sphingomonas sp. CFBP8993]|uniref:hydroxyisourate hydrolase n=1 Tax=Sphingomonas sp. CFBP8993 TaxID=3096526 RepID=UPI0039C9FADD
MSASTLFCKSSLTVRGTNEMSHYHVRVVVGPYGYSTYQGSRPRTPRHPLSRCAIWV